MLNEDFNADVDLPNVYQIWATCLPNLFSGNKRLWMT